MKPSGISSLKINLFRQWVWQPCCREVTPYNLPCSLATQSGVMGGLVSLFAAILPPTILMFALVSVLHRIQREAWLSRFVEGLTPAVAVLILTVAWKVLKSGTGGEFDWIVVTVGSVSLIAYLL
jgi:chromate transport protein ChrA